jgi:hypothetical protein
MAANSSGRSRTIILLWLRNADHKFVQLASEGLLLAAAPGLVDRRAGQIKKRNNDELADSRWLLGQLFSLTSTAGPARELRTFGVTGALLAEHTRLGDELNRRALRAARRAAVWQAAGWLLLRGRVRGRGRGAGAARRARPHLTR